MAVWPASLPQKQFMGLTLQDVPNVVRTPVAPGEPAKVRRRFTKAVQLAPTPMQLTQPQKSTFDTFFRDTLASGSLAFDWEDPSTDGPVSMRFLEPPVWQLTSSRGARLWLTTLQLEILP